MKIILFFAVCIIVLSCEQQEKIVALDSILPKAESDTVSAQDTIILEEKFDFDRQIAARFGWDILQISHVENPLFLDRFSPITKRKYALKLKQDTIFYYQWTFADSTKTNNAFYNWLDCFGDKCQSFKWNQQANFQRDNFAAFFNDTSITYITSRLRMRNSDWMNYFKDKDSIQNWKICLEQKHKGKVSWSKMVEGEKLPL